MQPNEIEITVPVQLEASINFRVDREKWNAMSAEERLAMSRAMGEKIHLAFDNGNISSVIPGDVSFYGVIQEHRMDLLSVYDPVKEG